MKNLAIAVLLLASLQWSHADNALKNGDFADGAQYWHGDGKTPADAKPQDALDKSPDYGDKGLIVILKPHAWTKVVQEVKSPHTSFTLHVTYKLSPDASFSSDDRDYVNVTHSIGFDAWSPIDGKRGGWMSLVCDISNYMLCDQRVMPRVGYAGEQTFTDSDINSLPIDDEKTVCLAFPPGTGTVILLQVSLEPK